MLSTLNITQMRAVSVRGSCEVGTMNIIIWHMRKLRHRGIKVTQLISGGAGTQIQAAALLHTKD